MWRAVASENSLFGCRWAEGPLGSAGGQGVGVSPQRCRAGNTEFHSGGGSGWPLRCFTPWGAHGGPVACKYFVETKSPVETEVKEVSGYCSPCCLGHPKATPFSHLLHSSHCSPPHKQSS